MSHAFLIIAHNDFEVLQLLVSALDDVRNDIYVHIDKKVKHLPGIRAAHSRLFVLTDRIDVRWGNVSQIEAELLLWEKALKNGPYEFYHLISGTHLPLKSVDEICDFFRRNSGKCLFSNLQKKSRDYQEILKLHRINICTSGYASSNRLVAGLSQFFWKSFIAIQRLLRISVNDGIQFYWANNWCSLSQEAVEYLLSQKKAILKRYRWSFCGDEWFVPTELMNSVLRDSVINSKNLLYGSIGRSNASVLSIEDAEAIKESDCCFGRKFTSRSKELINMLNINE